jgi:hypothetical protein
MAGQGGVNPYLGLPWQQRWRASLEQGGATTAEIDCGRRFTFDACQAFATAGSCFGQHLSRHLVARGVRVIQSESRHPLVPEGSGHGYGVFSARYGNIYSARHLRELFEQALGHRPPIGEFAQRPDGRWVDLLRPAAVPAGFASEAHARADRAYHLYAVGQMLRELDVLVYTIGLTEAWIDAQGFAYPLAPGVVAGTWLPDRHRFVNFTCSEVVADLRDVVALLTSVNDGARVLLTVSPVNLVATAEPRSVIVSSAASKAVLRAAVDEVVRGSERIDYFPSYELITGALARGRFWSADGRTVTDEGVAMVMDVFMQSRMPGLESGVTTSEPAPAVPSSRLQEALDRECDEQFLDPVTRP